MSFDAEAATTSYIDSLGEEALAQAAAYTTGNHWLILWSLIVSVLVTALLIRSHLLDRVETRLGQRGYFVRVFCVAASYIVLSSILELPWSLYAGWWREFEYGRTAQPLADFMSQAGIGLALNAIIMGLFFTAVYAVIQRARRWWWLWSGLVSTGLVTFMLLAGPVLIEPLFNDYQPIPEGEVKEAVEALAIEAGIPTDRVFMYDGSRQSNNFTANVSGIGSSARIAISDVAIGGATLDEVKAVTGHEIGHYILGHAQDVIVWMSALIMLSFFVADRIFAPVARWFGAEEDIARPTTLPVLMLVVGLVTTISYPAGYALSRSNEIEADQYSLDTVNLPHALASALVKTAEYRNPRPGELEEVLFYTHPSVERRVRRAMDHIAAQKP